MKIKTTMLFIEWMTEISKAIIENSRFETAQKIGQLCLDLQAELRREALGNEKVH